MKTLKRIGTWIVAICGTVAIMLIVVVIARVLALSIIRALS